MNLLLVGDLHLRYTAPQNRKDDYRKTQNQKVKFIFNCAKENNALILQAGDVFDSPREPYQVINEYLESINAHPGINIITVYGQHDLRYHTDFFNTPLQTLHMASTQIGCATVVPYDLPNDIHIYGANWNEEIPEIIRKGFNILIIHKIIIGNDKLWKDQKDFTYAKHLLRQYKYDLIVSGDNHQFFMSQEQDRFLFNMGSVFRAKIDQSDHIPQVCLFNTDTKEYKLIPIPIRPAEEVFRVEKVQTAKEKNLQLDSFMDALQKLENGDDTDIQIEEVFLNYMKVNNIDTETQNLVLESLGGINAKRIN